MAAPGSGTSSLGGSCGDCHRVTDGNHARDALRARSRRPGGQAQAANRERLPDEGEGSPGTVYGLSVAVRPSGEHSDRRESHAYDS